SSLGLGGSGTPAGFLPRRRSRSCRRCSRDVWTVKCLPGKLREGVSPNAQARRCVWRTGCVALDRLEERRIRLEQLLVGSFDARPFRAQCPLNATLRVEVNESIEDGTVELR